ncbi:MAG TPA: dienelactone hydrolase family protein [Candidatus Acidoferrales bacterium]|nr:dienelactone hydrolase family protein [Candidatus Acidoferrales bacterium]
MRQAFRTFAAITVLGLLAAIVSVRADAPKTETVQFANGAGTVGGFLATPEKPGRYPALVVIHEWWGLTDWIKEQAQKLAAQGYVALAVDLYRGKTATDPEAAHELMRGLPQDRAVSDLKAAFAYLATRKDVDRDHIGSIGWCMGGGFSLQLAIHEPRLAACVVNYGALPTDPNDIQQIYAPLLGNFGAEDRGITPADVQAFEKTMKDMKRRVDLKIYDGAGHGFENPTNTAGYRPEATADAWARTLAFLSKTMK